MAISKFLPFLFLLVLISCKNNPERPEPILDANYEPAPAVSTTPPAQKTPEPPQNAQGVWHYTCPNGHDGGSGSATPCSVCGTTLVHNQFYHAEPPGSDNVQIINADEAATPTSITTTPPAIPPKTPEPAQNAQGVWHYTCPNGHDGGSGSATPCSVCGTTLVHNQGYH